jgi:nucleoside phosphorylase
METLFDEHYDKLGRIYGKQAGDTNIYMTGRISSHNVVLVYTPGMGNRNSASMASGLRISFTGIKLALVVGICGGVPFPSEGPEIILGDVIISDSIIEYDYGRQYLDRFQWKSDVKETFGQPSQEIRSFLNSIQTHQMQVELQKQISQHLKYLEDTKGSEWKYLGSAHDILFESSYQHKHYQQSLDTECVCTCSQSSQDLICE